MCSIIFLRAVLFWLGPLKRPPAWLKRPVGVSFGFGGKLVSFAHKPGQSQDPQTGQIVQIDKAEMTIQQV